MAGTMMSAEYLPSKSAEEVCGPYSACEDWAMCPFPMFRTLDLKNMKRDPECDDPAPPGRIRRLQEEQTEDWTQWDRDMDSQVMVEVDDMGQVRQSKEVENPDFEEWIESAETDDIDPFWSRTDDATDDDHDDDNDGAVEDPVEDEERQKDQEEVNMLYRRYEELADKLHSNPSELDYEDVNEGRFLINSLKHIHRKRGDGIRRKLQGAALMSDVTNAKKDQVVAKDQEKAKDNPEAKNREKTEKDRKREKREKEAEKRRAMGRRRRRLREKKIDNTTDLESELVRHQRIHQTLRDKVDDIESVIEAKESRIVVYEDRLMEWTERQSESSWMHFMAVIEEKEEQIWALKEVRDDLYHHIWILEEEIDRLLVKVAKLHSDRVRVGFKRFQGADNLSVPNDGALSNSSSQELVVYESVSSVPARRRLGLFSIVKGAIMKILNALLKMLMGALEAIGDAVADLVNFIVDMVNALIDMLTNLFKILLFAFKADVRGLVDFQVSLDFVFKMNIFFVRVEFCIHLTLQDLEDGLSDAADKTAETHTDEQENALDAEASRPMDGDGNVAPASDGGAPQSTPAPLKGPEIEEPLAPRSGIPKLGLSLDQNWCEMLTMEESGSVGSIPEDEKNEPALSHIDNPVTGR